MRANPSSSRPVAAVLAAAALVSAMLAACTGDADSRARADTANLPAAARVAAAPERLGLGSVVPAARLAAIDIDANASGRGLPPGRGTHAEGARLYAARCASCHGVAGEGIATYPRLVGPATDTTFAFGRDVKLVKTPGNYWPHATTLYDYVHRAMPHNAPGSLRPDEVYALVAFILAENQVIPREAVMDARTLPAVRMPARDRFVPDDRTGGRTFR